MKLQAELAKLKVDLDEANIAHEGTLAALRQKHNNSMAELGNQIDAINKNKVTDNFQFHPDLCA